MRFNSVKIKKVHPKCYLMCLSTTFYLKVFLGLLVAGGLGSVVVSFFVIIGSVVVFDVVGSVVAVVGSVVVVGSIEVVVGSGVVVVIGSVGFVVGSGVVVVLGSVGFVVGSGVVVVVVGSIGVVVVG